MRKIINKPKALLLFSGGLDSILAAKILEGQGIRVTALTFEGYFFDGKNAKKFAKLNGIENIRSKNFSEKHFKIVKNPRFGRGRGMNPCIDCHLLMIRETKKIAKKEKYDIIATGEVLGQRPMSQNIRALQLIEREANLTGKILRPLSARVLPETDYEKAGMVFREKLLAISGRGRKPQLLFAKKYKIDFFPTPAGGCILTDTEYSKKLADLFEKQRRITENDLILLRIGRHFWSGTTRIVLGRNHEENLILKKNAIKGDSLIEPKDIPGPTALIRGRRNNAVLDFTKNTLLKYTKGAGEDTQLRIIASG